MPAAPNATKREVVSKFNKKRPPSQADCPRYTLFMFYLPAFILTVALAFGQSATVPFPLTELSWLAGCWEMRQGGRTTLEHWMAPAGALMLGMSRTVRDGKAIEYEFLRISQEADGIYYIALPSGQRETRFKLTDSNGRTLVFQNPEHDFPQTITYELNEDGSLLASIAGKSGDQQKTIEFPMQRVTCGGLK